MSYNRTIKIRLQDSEVLRRAYLRESVNSLLTGELETGKSLLRKYINGTVGFVKLGADLDKSPKVIMRMLSPKGNPQARNLFEIIAHLQKLAGTVFEVVEHKA